MRARGQVWRLWAVVQIMLAIASLGLSGSVLIAAGGGSTVFVALWAWQRRAVRDEFIRVASLLWLVAAGAIALITSQGATETMQQVARLYLGMSAFVALQVLRPRMHWIGVSVVACSAALCAAGLLSTNWIHTKLQGLNVVYAWLPRVARLDLVHPNVLAGHLILLIPLLYAAARTFADSSSRRWRALAVLSWLLNGLSLLLLVLSQSRAALLALPAAAVLYVLCGRLRPARAWWIAAAVGGAVFVLSIVGLSTSFGYIHRTWPESAPLSLLGRLEMWHAALRLIGVAPLFGIGIGRYTEAAFLVQSLFVNTPDTAPHAHQLYLQIAVDLGVPALTAWCCLVADALRRVMTADRGQSESPYVRWLPWIAAAILAALVHGLFDAVIWGMVRAAPLFWMLLGVSSLQRGEEGSAEEAGSVAQAAAYRVRRKRVLPHLLRVAAAALAGVIFVSLAASNLATVTVMNLWRSIVPASNAERSVLRDGLPDGWMANSWGGSTQSQTLIDDACSGSRAARIDKRNAAGASSYTQIIDVRPNRPLTLELCTRGGIATITLRPVDVANDDVRYIGSPQYRALPASMGWTKHTMTFASQDQKKMQLWLVSPKSGKSVDFDAVMIADDLGPLVVANGDFESDGPIHDVLWNHTELNMALLRFVDAVVEVLPYSDHAYNLRAQLAWMHGDDARLQQMLRAQRRVNVAWMVRGADRLQAAGDVAGAQQLLDLALAYEPTNHAARLIYGRMLARASSFEAALQQFEQAGSRRYGFVAYESGITRLLGTGDLARAVPDLVLAGGDPRLAMLIRPRVELAARYSLESGDVFCADLDDFEAIARAVDSSATSDLVRARRATCRP